MIEIKSYSGRVLYTAENASDVRTALEEAVRSDANLRDANLYGANLRGAYLRGAYLGGADLRGADLRGAYLGGANLSDANLYGANLGGADLGGADLRDANLSDANLYGAYLGGANLRDANLRGANLSDANLGGANLSGAKGLVPERVTPLLMLTYQPGPIRAFKLVNSNGQSPMQYSGRLTYEVGQSLEVSNAETDPSVLCGAGINVATLDWILNHRQDGWRVFVVEFTAADIACIPTGTDGKFRLHRCTVVDELDISAMVGA